MKKNKIKNYLKTGILLLGIPLLLLNCEKENSIESNQLDNPINYKVTSLDNLIDLKPVIENVKNVNSKSSASSKSSDNFLNLTNINTKEIIQYTNQTGYSTYTFKFENDSETINFENLYLHETEKGYIAYILSFEPNPDWYYSNLSDEGFLLFDIATYQGNITKYSLEREIIWTTKEELISKSSIKNTTAKTSVAGYFVQICVISPPAPCDEHRHSDAAGWDGCAYSDGKWTESCQTVWVSGGASYPNDNPDDGTSDGVGGGTTTDNTDCTSVSGTSISDTQPISGITTDCAPNTTTGISTTSEYQAFWMGLSTSQQDFLNLRPTIKNNVLNYLSANKYAPQAQKLVTNTINENYDFLLKNNFSPKAEVFSELAIEAVLKGGSVDYVDKIILDKTFLDNPKAICVYNKLKEAGGIKEILKDFFDTQKTANLIIKLEPNLTCNNSSNPFGCTSFKKSTQTATIKIDTDFITQFQWNNSGGIYQTPLLNIAKVIIHESIHAQFFYNKYQVNNNIVLSDFTFEDLYEEYRKLEGWQHQFMADHYLNTIADALREVHPLLNDQTYIDYINNNYPDWTWSQIYTNMAWSGLTQTPSGKEYLSDTNNANLYSLQNINVATNSNKTPNCNK